VRLGDGDAPWSGRLVTIEPEPSSPAAARERFGPLPGAADAGPVAVAWAALTPPAATVGAYRGATGAALVTVGRGRLLTLADGRDAAAGSR
jgi:hypothetical protein